MPSPDWRKCTAYRQTGLGGLPLALRLSEGLGVSFATLDGGSFAKLDGTDTVL